MAVTKCSQNFLLKLLIRFNGGFRGNFLSIKKFFWCGRIFQIIPKTHTLRQTIPITTEKVIRSQTANTL